MCLEFNLELPHARNCGHRFWYSKEKLSRAEASGGFQESLGARASLDALLPCGQVSQRAVIQVWHSSPECTGVYWAVLICPEPPLATPMNSCCPPGCPGLYYTEGMFLSSGTRHWNSGPCQPVLCLLTINYLIYIH